jgi:DNA mismatch endonuclease (patch repair protein)
MPAANREWWAKKLARNRTRDLASDQALTDAGWRVVRVWEHEDAREAADRIEQIVCRDA